MEQVLLDQIIALRAQLHACAEVSGREAVTKHTLLTFLREHTSLELHELAGGFYAAHREPEGTKSTVALRADYDALATPEGGAAHLCGHDGHAAALCGVALMLEGQSIGRSVFLLFLRRTQPAGLSVRRGAHPRGHLCLRQPRRDDSFCW